MNKYIRRITTSRRGELFNPLIWPFLITTLTYGIGFAFFGGSEAVGASSVFQALHTVAPIFPLLWGIVAILTIVGGLSFLLFNIPPIGRATGLIGFALWLMIAISYVVTGAYLTLISVAGANMFFWGWQYASLSRFRREDAQDAADTKSENIDRLAGLRTQEEADRQRRKA